MEPLTSEVQNENVKQYIKHSGTLEITEITVHNQYTGSISEVLFGNLNTTYQLQLEFSPMALISTSLSQPMSSISLGIYPKFPVFVKTIHYFTFLEFICALGGFFFLIFSIIQLISSQVIYKGFVQSVTNSMNKDLPDQTDELTFQRTYEFLSAEGICNTAQIAMK